MKPRKSLTALVASIAAFALPAVALEYNDGTITWNYVPVEGSTTEVCLGDGTNACIAATVEGAITLPDTIGGKRVTKVAANAFKGCTKVTGVSILGNLEWIEEGAFDGATSLKTFGTLNRNENFFSYQGSLYMGDWENAELVCVPSALEVEEFTGLVKPQVWYVYPGAFNGCVNIRRIQVNEASAEALYECSLGGCSALDEFVWAEEYWDEWSEYCVKDGVLYCGDYERDGGCELIKWPTAKPLESFESMVLSANSEFTVADGAFAGNPMEKITIPAWTWVSSYAFAGCANLREIVFLGSSELSGGALSDLEDVGINLKKVIYPGFPKGMAEEWEDFFDSLKEEYGACYSNIVYEKMVDPNHGKPNLTIPYTERWDLCWRYDFEAYAKDLTTLTFEGPCPDDFVEILEICSNVTTVVYSANPLYRDCDYDWESWKSVMSWDWAGELPGRSIAFREGAIPSETQFYFEDPEYRECLYGIWYYDAERDCEACVSPIWPAVGELKIPDGVYELGDGALYGLDQVTKLVLPKSMAWEGYINENVGFETMSALAEIAVEGGASMSMCGESSVLYSKEGILYYEGELFRVPPAYEVDEFVLGYSYYNALTGCKNIKKLTARDPECLEFLLYELDLTGCDQLVAFACNDGRWESLADYDYAIVDGAIYENWGYGELCLSLWPNAKRPVAFAENTVAVNSDAFRYFENPGAVTELTIAFSKGCFDLYGLAAECGFTNVTKLVFKDYPGDLAPDLLEVMPNLSEIVYPQVSLYADDWEWVLEDFAETGVRFTPQTPTEPVYGYDLDVWEEDDHGNVLDGECYLGFVGPALTGAYEIPEKIENCRVVWVYDYAFANMDELTELTFPQHFRGFEEAGSYREEYYDADAGEWVTTGEVDIVYSPFVGCSSLSKLVFKGGCPEGLWEVLEVTPTIREVVYNAVPWDVGGGWWCEFIEEFKAEHPASEIVFTPVELPQEPIWHVEYGALNGEYEPESGLRASCVWPDLSGEVAIPSNVYYIGENAFACMSNLTALTIPAAVYEISEAALVGCTSLKKLVFSGFCPESLEGLLVQTPSIEEVVYNSVPPWFGDYYEIFEFADSWNLFIQEFKEEHPDSRIKFKCEEYSGEPIWNCEYDYYYGERHYYGDLYGEYEPETGWRVPCVIPDLVGEAEIPNGVYSVGENAFACMSNLTALTIPTSVEGFDVGTYREGYWDEEICEWVVTGEEDIVYSPFVGCTSLKKLIFKGGYIPDGIWELLELTPSIEEVVVPSWQYRGSACGDGEWNEWLEWFVMEYKAEYPDSAIVFKRDNGTVIEGYVERSPWTVDGNTMTVDKWAGLYEGIFDGSDLSGVTKLVLPSCLDYVDDGVFGVLTNLCEVEAIFTSYGDETTYFGSKFGEEQRLKLTIKPNIWWCCDCEYCETASIDDVFCPICKAGETGDCDETCGCPGHWEIEDFAIQPEQFENAEWIETLVIEEPAFAIGDYAFAGCVNLKEAVIPASVEWMGESVFADCEKLEKVSYGGNAPYGCAWLYDGASSNLVSYVKCGTTGWTGVDGEAGMPIPALWPVWDDGDAAARPVEYGKITDTGYAIVYLPNGGAGEMDYQACARGKVYNLAKCAFRKSGKAFKGWMGSNGKRYDDGVLIFNAAAEGKVLALTAIWE